mgnify:CR=1 FL=1
MPRLRINLREERAPNERDRREISPLALQRRQDQRKFGKDVARMLRERKSPKA